MIVDAANFSQSNLDQNNLPQNRPLIMCANNRYYAGMTLKEAKVKDLEKSFWRRDFHNIDKNGDGVLSVDEIMNERKRSSKINKILAGVFTGLGVLDCLGSKGTPTFFKLLDIGFDAFIAITSFNKARRTDKGTKEYEELIQNGRLNCNA